jgi:rRNA maturation RNase YbeY
MPVSFYFDDVKKPEGFVAKQLRIWLKAVGRHHQFRIKDLTYIFVNDEKLLEINRQFLQHDTYTDIITFDFSNNKEEISGEIYISLERIEENAQKFDVSFWEELLRVAAHGLLHLIGFKDKTKKEKALMTEQENLCILMYQEL